MPRKTKETIEEKDEKIKSKTKTAKATSTVKKTTAKKSTAKASTKSKTTKKTATTTKAKAVEKAPKKAVEGKPKKATKTATTSDKKKATKKATTTAKKSATTTKKTTTKKDATKKPATKSTSKSASKTAKVAKAKTATKIKASTTKSTKKSVKVVPPSIVEYYDLPYKYNQTIVKVLYKNPTTLFVYWEISDSDIENYKNTYGENFFETTRPVLLVYNDTMNYKFEVAINDFANCWYFNINDSKCNYRIELIRRPISYNEKIKTEYIYITSSNRIESPNDRILFSTNEPYTVYFRNVKNNNQRKVNLPKLLEQLNLLNRNSDFPIVRNVYDLYKNIYHIEDVGEFSISLTNPSSSNPSSHSLSSRFI